MATTSAYLIEKWTPVLDHEEIGSITDRTRRMVTAQILENQEISMQTERRHTLEEAGAWNQMGGTGAFGAASPAAGPHAGFDPVMIALTRRVLPNLMAFDVMGVQAMSAPTQTIFAQRTRYGSNTANGLATNPEAFYNEPDSSFSGIGTHDTLTIDSNSADWNIANATANMNPGSSTFGVANTGTGMTTGNGEILGTGTGVPGVWGEMGFTIERVTVTAVERALKAEYTTELAQDLKAVHGLDADTELNNILQTEIVAEQNREAVRTIYGTAKVGAQNTSKAGWFQIRGNADSDGRWQVEKYKSLIFQAERESNQIAKDTRRGKGNIIICSTDVASALAMSGLLDYDSGIVGKTSLNVDDTGNTYAGSLFGRVKVYVDPYSVVGADFMVVGYKGSNSYDAGLFFCPYIGLQQFRAVDPATMQPKIAYKTRYGLVANPFAEGAVQGLGRITTNSNVYYRKFVVWGLR